MTGLVGKWLFPHAAPNVRRQRMHAVWFSVAVLLLLCAGMAAIFWLLNKRDPL